MSLTLDAFEKQRTALLGTCFLPETARDKPNGKHYKLKYSGPSGLVV